MRVPDIHDTDSMDYERFLRGGFRPDPEIEKWVNDLKTLLMEELGFDEMSADEVMRIVEPDFNLEPEDFLKDLHFCQCSWTGRTADLEFGLCPECGSGKV